MPSFLPGAPDLRGEGAPAPRATCHFSPRRPSLNAHRAMLSLQRRGQTTCRPDADQGASSSSVPRLRSPNHPMSHPGDDPTRSHHSHSPLRGQSSTSWNSGYASQSAASRGFRSNTLGLPYSLPHSPASFRAVGEEVSWTSAYYWAAGDWPMYPLALLALAALPLCWRLVG